MQCCALPTVCASIPTFTHSLTQSLFDLFATCHTTTPHQVLDRYFGSVCELDIIFNFHKAYYVLDEIFIGGQLQETSKRKILQMCAIQDELMEESANATDR